MQYLWKKQESLHLGPFKQDKDCQGEEESTLATLCQKLQVKKCENRPHLKEGQANWL
jgi:hypothetical protein